MNYLLMGYCFIIHFIADFLLQSRDMARNKSSNLYYLIEHCKILAIVFFAFLYPFMLLNTFIFILTNTLIHGIIDWHIWRIYKWIRRKENINTFKYWEDSLFYSFIGLDQLLHGLTIIGILWYLQ